MKADEGGIHDLDEGIVHLPVAHDVDARVFEALRRAACDDRAERAAVAVRAHGEGRGRGEEDAALRVHGGHAALTEEDDVLFLKAEEGVVAEELSRRGVV